MTLKNASSHTAMFIILGCMTQEDEDCQCIFPFKADGTSYETCVDPFNEGGLWCATAIQSDGEYSDYGWCVEGGL